ncbi:hypothetical protein BDD12DRAFT_826043 [Trichophaea hybrida]|nr:hypothetical protein BDD12DRAFT_826043 [Trichophaea hybrida]
MSENSDQDSRGLRRVTEDTSATSSDSTPSPLQPQESLQRVRFSTEVGRPGSLDTIAPSSSAQGLRNEAQSATNPGSVTSPRKRSRGYSLRRQLFFRNTHGQSDDGVQSEGAVHGALIARSNSNDWVELRNLEKKSSPVLKRLASGGTYDGKRWGAFRANGIPFLWAQKHYTPFRDKVISLCVEIKKTILRTHELPPSKDGRRIPLNAERKDVLIDERTGHHYVNNIIRSSRYTVWNFLPRQLFAQFSKLANFYFLCVSILQMIPRLSTTGTYTTFVPLIFFISLSMFKEGYDDYRRYKLDKSENGRDAQVFAPQTAESSTNASIIDLVPWKTTSWKDIRVGDIVQLERDDWVPADLLIIHSKGEHGIAYIETMALDGETNLKSKQALPIIAEQCDALEKLAAFRAEIVVEDPNPDLYKFEGKVNIGEDTKPLTGNQVIYRGSILRNTPSMIGMVIFSGEETKIRMNANKNPRTKAPALQALVNKIVIMIVIFVISLAVFNSVSYQFWREDTEQISWYLINGTVAFFHVLASYVIMFNTLIPLSLYVMLEMIKVAQMFLLNDIDMYHEETNTPFEARTSTINEDCGQVSYIFSDKTGTLTDNSMLFRKLSVGGHAWLHDLDIQNEAGTVKLKHKRRKSKGKGRSIEGHRKSSVAFYRSGDPSSEMPQNTRKSMGDVASPRPPLLPHKTSLEGLLEREDSLRRKSSTITRRPQLSTLDLLEYLKTHPHTLFARKARFFLLSIALCHTCLPEVDKEDGSIEYQAASPDEVALVRAAQELGYIAIERQFNSITIRSFPNGTDGEPLIEVYEILDVIEFSSKRKRMTIIIRLPNKRICIFSKGADSTMIELLQLRELAKSKAREVERRASIRKSLEAQEVIRRNSVHRPNIGGRPSIGGPSRASTNLSRRRSVRNELALDELLRYKERDADAISHGNESTYSRPSAQYGARHSIAFGDVPNMPLDRDVDGDIVDENLAADDARVFERCFAQVNHFATEGLRTLLYGHRFIEEQEYQVWKNIYTEATTSLVDRTSAVERAAEIIERDFELTGATAIEDKLQKGVPEAIEKLRRAGIKLWMLTGDKRETAINIGRSCRLIKDCSTITILHQDDVSIAETIKSAISDIYEQKVAHGVVVIDGGTLVMVESDEVLKSLFFEIAVLTDSVICCRASPSQKAHLVKTIRTKVQKSVTLAIGDGANDIAMIQEAHVGVGIAGKEGHQAARASDYSMAQFRFLLKFLLVHGRWNYVRTTKYTLCTFWKEILFYLTQASFQRFNGYTGSSLYEPWSLSMFNTLFTSLPVLFIGIFEKDLAASTLLAVPELYNYGQLNRGFSFRIYFGWMLLGVSQSMLAYFLMYRLYAPRLMVDQSVFAMGCLTFSVCVTVISSKIQLIEMHNKSIAAAISFVLSVGGWFLWNIILSSVYTHNVIHNVKGSFLHHFGADLSWWLVYIFSVSACLLLDVLFIAIRVAFLPTDVDDFRELEKSRVMRQRFEEAASDELQQGWSTSKKPSLKEKEILDRPGDIEEGRSKRDGGVEEIVARKLGNVGT